MDELLGGMGLAGIAPDTVATLMEDEDFPPLDLDERGVAEYLAAVQVGCEPLEEVRWGAVVQPNHAVVQWCSPTIQWCSGAAQSCSGAVVQPSHAVVQGAWGACVPGRGQTVVRCCKSATQWRSGACLELSGCMGCMGCMGALELTRPGAACRGSAARTGACASRR